MKYKIIIGIAIIALISLSFAITAEQHEIGGNWESVNKTTIFPTLVSSDAGLTSGEAIFDVHNPLNKNLSSKYFERIFEAKKGEIQDVDTFVKENVTKNRTLYTEEEYNATCTRVNNETGENESYQCTQTRTVENGTETYTDTAWKEFDKLPDGNSRIKLVGYWNAGKEVAIKWYPKVKFPKNLTGHTEDLNITRQGWKR